MDKIDKTIIEKLSSQCKFDNQLVGILSKKEYTHALVRVRNPLQFGLLERNFRVTAHYPFIRTVGIECGLKDAIRLERMQEVEYVSAQSKVFAFNEPNFDKKDFSNDKEFLFNNVFSMSKELDGEGVTMCVMDTGILPHSDISIPRERIKYFVDMIGNEKEPYDDNGHGTFISGIACGNGLLSAREIAGVAPRANLVGIKVIGQNGESGTFKILDGMQWLFDNFRRYGIKVVCMSFGADPLPYADPLKLGAEMLVKSGIIVVVAAGNSGENGVKSPAISRDVIAVGAVDSSGEIAQFSSRGAYQGVFRPDVYSLGVDAKGIVAGGTYGLMSGTSAAAPYVAGACCLLCQKYRNITPLQAKNAILNNSIIKNGVHIISLVK